MLAERMNRLGYGIMPEWLALQIAKLQANCTSCTPPFTQMAGAEALTGPQDESIRMMAEFKQRRDIVVEGLNAIPGISCIPPKGSFYAFPNITGTGMTSKVIADYLLEQAGVAALNGTSFGQYGEGYLRISFANSEENLMKALQRIEAALNKKTLDKDRQ